MNKKNKAILIIVLSLLFLAVSAYLSGYRFTSKQLVNEYIKESGIQLTHEVEKIYKEKNVETYLLESDEFYITLGFERNGFLWRLPKRDVTSYSENFDKVAGKIIINKKEKGKDIFFLAYPTMYSYSQTLENVKFKSFLISDSKIKEAYVYSDGKYNIIPFKLERDNLYSIESSMPSYIKTDQYTKATFPRFSIWNTDEKFEVEICNHNQCEDSKLLGKKINQMIFPTDEIYGKKEINEIKNKFKEKTDLKITFKNLEDNSIPTDLRYHYDKVKHITYVWLPEIYETEYFNDDGTPKSKTKEDAYFVIPGIVTID